MYTGLPTDDFPPPYAGFVCWRNKQLRSVQAAQLWEEALDLFRSMLEARPLRRLFLSLGAPKSDAQNGQDFA